MRFAADIREDNRQLFMRLAVVVVAMFAFGFALVPFYEKICQVTGLRNVLQPDEVVNSQVDYGRSIRIELDANTRNLPWTFHPVEPVISAHPGEVTQVMYEIENRTSRTVTGQAIPSYAPIDAGRYFRKLECFCFAKQTLGPGEKRRMPVVFSLDPQMPADMATIALSYTFFEVEGNGNGAGG